MKEKRANVGFIRMLVLLLMVSLLLCALAACGAGASSPVGKWYNEKGKCLDIRKDGSWKLEDSYGTGTWKKLDDGIFEFTDFYGDTQESAINEDESGQYIDFGYYGDFYRDAYPAGDATETGKANMAITIDPFENLSYEISGISPYCEVSVNNSRCNAEVQKYVTYNLDKEVYANGDTVIVSAELASNTGGANYKMTTTTSEYQISNQPEYITELKGIDLSVLLSELSDTLEAEKAQAAGGDELFTMGHWLVGGTNFKSCDQITAADVYFSTLKGIRLSEFDMKKMPFNRLSFTYSVDYTWENTNRRESGDGKFWVNISAGNIIKYPDGKVKWGYTSSDDYNFACSYSQKGLEDCVSTTIMNNKDNYNISKVDLAALQKGEVSATAGEIQQEVMNNSLASTQSNQEQGGASQEYSLAHSHKYVAEKKISATCTAEGYTVYRCSCGASYNGNKANKLGHSYKNTVIAATTNSQGYALHTCTRCGHSYKDSYTEKITKPSTAIPGDSSEKEIIEDPIDFDDLIGNG